jgi:beta-lactamase class A
MKSSHLVRFTFVAMLALLLGACSSLPTMPWSKNQLAGTWKNSLGTVWTIKSDGTFTADVHHAKIHASGTYKISGDTFTITETGAKVPQVCKGDAVYHFHRDGVKLHFTVVSDKCKIRKADVTKEWTAVK